MTWARRPAILGPGQVMRILVVDDDPPVAEVIAEAVRTQGDEALVCLDATEALQTLETTQVDGVFLDLVMPGMGGLEALARIRGRHPDIPVIILSGHADQERVEQALALGAAEVVQKPAALTVFTDALARLKRG